MSQATVSIAFVRSALQTLDAAQRAQVLHECAVPAGLLAQDGARVEASRFAALWMAVAQVLDDEFFGLDSRRMKVGSFAMLCHALAGQRQLGRALRQALAGFRLFLDDMQATLRVSSGMASVIIYNRIGPGGGLTKAAAADARRFADETLLVMVHGLLCWLAGRRVQLTRLDWAHARPAHGDEYGRMFSPVLHFDAPATAMHFDARLLQAQVQVDEASLRRFLRDAPQSVFLKQVASTGWSDRVAQQCRQALADGQPAPTLSLLAEGLELSAATLRRRLEGEGSTWQQQKDRVRCELALQLLADPQHTVSEVADRLGFNDASTFYRAFRKWTGAAPGAWRQGGDRAVRSHEQT